MGKSPNACFKIISCGADSTDADDELSPPESKQSSDKRRWSFRKRSARPNVPSNTVISEPQFVGLDKENPDKLYSVKHTSLPEKTPTLEEANATAPLPSTVALSEKFPFLEPKDEPAQLTSEPVRSQTPPIIGQTNDKAPFSSGEVNAEVKVTPESNKTYTADANLQEDLIILIQAAARRFLAAKELKTLKNVVKLQAAIRGHLVRRQAIGTLRCVQAIAKMQALVRAHRARECHMLEKCSGQEKNDKSQNKLVKHSDLKSNHSSSTVEKLLSNGFARQLLENSSKSKPIHIKCDPVRQDSAWQWLERWMSVTSSKAGQQEELICVQSFEGETTHQELNGYPSAEASALFGLELSPENPAVAEGEQDPKNDNVGQLAPTFSGSELSPKTLAAADGEWYPENDKFSKLEYESSPIISDQCSKFSAESKREQSRGEEAICRKEENSTQTTLGKAMSDTGPKFADSAHDDHPYDKNSATETLKQSTKTATSDLQEIEGKTLDHGSKKIRNPVFAAVQAKFEELSSASKASQSVSVCRSAAAESKPIHSQVVSLTKNKDLGSTENLTVHNSVNQAAVSECGTEISVSSTLDSPDRSETDGGEIVLEIGNSAAGGHIVNIGSMEPTDLGNTSFDAKTQSSDINEFEGQRSREGDEHMANSIASVDSVNVEQHQMEITMPNDFNEHENLKEQVCRSSPERSPGNHVTSESHGTPSSQVSTQSKTSKRQTKIPAAKLKSKSTNKSSPSNLKNDSAEMSGTEHFPKDATNSDRRSSFGMAKLDQTDTEPRRSSSTSLPSYMQATESAKAKVHGSVSLKSSPDVNDKDNNLKKRHSLPMGDEKQGSSPRVQRPTPQAKQSLKRNDNHSPHSSAERRWQR